MADLYEIAQTMKASVEQEFAAADITLPERRYVQSGDVAFDCAQLTVNVGALGTGTPTADYQGQAHPGESPVAIFVLSLIRDCQPIPDSSGNPPPAAEIEAAAEILLADALLLTKVFLKSEHKKPAGCSKVKVVSCTPYGPEGAVAGWVLSLRAGLV